MTFHEENSCDCSVARDEVRRNASNCKCSQPISTLTYLQMLHVGKRVDVSDPCRIPCIQRRILSDMRFQIFAAVLLS